jgi:hypothetical protein
MDDDNEDDDEYSEETCSSVALCTTNPTLPDPDSNLDRRCWDASD